MLMDHVVGVEPSPVCFAESEGLPVKNLDSVGYQSLY